MPEWSVLFFLFIIKSYVFSLDDAAPYYFNGKELMKIAGKDFRQRAVEAYQSGEFTREEVAKMCGYTTTTAIGNWMRSFKQEGRITSLPRGH